MILIRNWQDLDQENVQEFIQKFVDLRNKVGIASLNPDPNRYQVNLKDTKISNIEIDRVAAKEFRLENRCEKINENVTIFSRIFNAFKFKL